MAYSRTNWVSGETPLSAGNLNNIEDGIEGLINTVGDVSTASKSTNTSVSATGYATICTLSLPAGVYVLTGHVRFASIPANRISVSVGTSASPGGEKDGVNMHYADAAANRNIGMQTSAIVTLSATTTVYLAVYADSNATVSHGVLTAVRLK